VSSFEQGHAQDLTPQQIGLSDRAKLSYAEGYSCRLLSEVSMKNDVCNFAMTKHWHFPFPLSLILSSVCEQQFIPSKEPHCRSSPIF